MLHARTGDCTTWDGDDTSRFGHEQSRLTQEIEDRLGPNTVREVKILANKVKNVHRYQATVAALKTSRDMDRALRTPHTQ